MLLRSIFPPLGLVRFFPQSDLIRDIFYFLNYERRSPPYRYINRCKFRTAVFLIKVVSGLERREIKFLLFLKRFIHFISLAKF